MLDNILYQEYVDDDEKDLIIACEQANLAVDKLFNTYTMLEAQKELNLREAELKCMEESGDMDELISLYEEAKAETAEKSQNIFVRIWNAILNAFRAVKNFITGKSQKIDENKEYEVPHGIIGNIKRGCKFIIGVIKAAGMGVFDTIKRHKGAAGFITASLGVCFFLERDNIAKFFKNGKKDKVSGAELKSATEDLNDVADAATEAAEKAQNNGNKEETDENKSLLAQFAEIVKGIPKNISYLVGLLTGKESNEESATEEPGKNQTGTDDLSGLDKKLNDTPGGDNGNTGGSKGKSPVKGYRKGAKGSVEVTGNASQSESGGNKGNQTGNASGSKGNKRNQASGKKGQPNNGNPNPKTSKQKKAEQDARNRVSSRERHKLEREAQAKKTAENRANMSKAEQRRQQRINDSATSKNHYGDTNRKIGGSSNGVLKKDTPEQIKQSDGTTKEHVWSKPPVAIQGKIGYARADKLFKKYVKPEKATELNAEFKKHVKKGKLFKYGDAKAWLNKVWANPDNLIDPTTKYYIEFGEDGEILGFTFVSENGSDFLSLEEFEMYVEYVVESGDDFFNYSDTEVFAESDDDFDSILGELFGESEEEYDDEDLEDFFGESSDGLLSPNDIDWA